MRKEIKELMSKLGIDRANALVQTSGGEPLGCDFEIAPEEFLDAAEEAFQRGEVGRVDAISNAQRAIRSQIDYALSALGYSLNKMSIRTKLEILKDLGLFAPRILNKVSGPRNLMEHQYRKPSGTEVEDALDIAALFVEAANRTLQNFWGDFYIGQKDNHGKGIHFFSEMLTFGFDHERKIYHVCCRKDEISQGRVEVTPSDPMFAAIHRIAIAAGRDWRVEPALKKFFDEIES